MKDRRRFAGHSAAEPGHGLRYDKILNHACPGHDPPQTAKPRLERRVSNDKSGSNTPDWVGAMSRSTRSALGRYVNGIAA